jgi:pyruvate/2-oxoglutarate dehydrogenase complex dihydrolipoamide acyltransferase (E2) component
MPIKITIPQLEMAMTAGTLAEWLVEDGADVKEGDLLYVLETGKAAEEIAAAATGTLKRTVVAGVEYPVGSVIGEIG